MKVRFGRLVLRLGVCAALALGAMACDSGDSSEGGNTTVDGGGTGGGDGSGGGDAGATDTGGGTPDTGGGTPDTGGGTPDTGGGEPDTGGGTPDTGGGGTGDTGGTGDAGGGGDTTVTPMESGLVCGQILACVDGCADGDDACIADCAGQAKNEAEAAEFGAFLECYGTNCAEAADGDACIAEKCADTWSACSVGDGTCAQVWFCSVECFNDDCAKTCKTIGTEEAQTQHDALNSCLASKCPSPVTQACRVEKATDAASCKAEAETCSPSGTKHCIGIVDDCIIPCKGDDACIHACIIQGDIEAQLAATRYWTCLELSCGPEPEFACKDFAKNHDCSSQSQDCTGL